MQINHNSAPPEVMHIDLNGAFAMTEQQANPLIRRRPVGVTNRLNDWAICITASYEAKRLGISLGTRFREARQIAPGFVMIESDAAKYAYVHKQMKVIFESYAPVAYMKSIDEGVIDFRGMGPILKGRPLEDIGAEIKQRVRDEVGDYMTVNVGIGQNRWLAKLAAGFMKPDGLYTIDRDNAETVYGLLDLCDLPYIKRRSQLRLNEAGIYTTLDFYRAPEPTLVKQVFKSINGHHWYLKLRGYETEVEFGIKTVGRNYVLEHRTSDPEELGQLLYKAAVKISRRLRKNNLAARGLMLYLGYAKDGGSQSGWGRTGSGGGFFQRKMYKVGVARADQIYARALELYQMSSGSQVVASLVMTSYTLEPVRQGQLGLFEDDQAKRDRLELAINELNDRYGELTVAPVAVAASKNPMKDKIPFGTIRYFD
jgi:DNA polymerase IV